MAGSDYTSVSMDLTINSGSTISQAVMIMASTDDRVENVETFSLSLTSGDPAVTVTTASATVTIEDVTSECIHL